MKTHQHSHSSFTSKITKQTNRIKRLGTQLSKQHPQMVKQLDEIIYAALKIEKLLAGGEGDPASVVGDTGRKRGGAVGSREILVEHHYDISPFNRLKPGRRNQQQQDSEAYASVMQQIQFKLNKQVQKNPYEDQLYKQASNRINRFMHKINRFQNKMNILMHEAKFSNVNMNKYKQLNINNINFDGNTKQRRLKSVSLTSPYNSNQKFNIYSNLQSSNKNQSSNYKNGSHNKEYQYIQIQQTQREHLQSNNEIGMRRNSKRYNSEQIAQHNHPNPHKPQTNTLKHPKSPNQPQNLALKATNPGRTTQKISKNSLASKKDQQKLYNLDKQIVTIIQRIRQSQEGRVLDQFELGGNYDGEGSGSGSEGNQEQDGVVGAAGIRRGAKGNQYDQ